MAVTSSAGVQWAGLIDDHALKPVGFVPRAWLSRPRQMAGRIRRLALACVVMVA
jgi:hypothetical protein